MAICGVNPHAGENGTIGKEEIKYLNPIIKELFNKYSDNIQIDLELFDSINLTSIPMN